MKTFLMVGIVSLFFLTGCVANSNYTRTNYVPYGQNYSYPNYNYYNYYPYSYNPFFGLGGIGFGFPYYNPYYINYNRYYYHNYHSYNYRNYHSGYYWRGRR